MSPSLNKQTNTKCHKREEQRTFLILGPFFERKKKLAIKDMMCDTSVPMTLQIELSNEQEQTQLFFLSNGKKLWVVLPYTPTLSRVFSATFSTWFSSLRSQSNSSQFFKTFFSYHCHTLAKIWKKKYYGPCENTHLYTWNCDFLNSPPANLLVWYIFLMK